VMKLMLQPIVENAIYHGLDDLNETMVITIGSELRQQQLALIISDNGIGIDEQRLAELNAGLRANSSSDDGDRKDAGGIGLKNVNERLKLQYGQSYGLHVNSTSVYGTEVLILLT